jgi:hypothetical protein
MSLSLAPGGASLRVHMESTLQPARRLVARLLEADAAFFREYHYLDPLGVDDSDNPLLLYFAYVERENVLFRDFMSKICPQSIFLYDLCVCRILFMKDS